MSTAKDLFRALDLCGTTPAKIPQACATDQALYVEFKGKYYKLDVSEISLDELNVAWDSITGEVQDE